MIYELSQAVETRIQSKKFPLRVVYESPERMQPGFQDCRIVFMRDREQGDTFQSPRGAQQNPKKVADRIVGARALLWIRSSLDGAMLGDHERECEKVVDAVFSALRPAAIAVGKIDLLTVGEARYLAPKELVDLGVSKAVVEAWPGVVYSLRFKVPRAVHDLDYDGNGLPSITLSGITGEVQVRRDGVDPPQILEFPNP